MKKIIFMLLILLPINLLAQNTKKLELSLSGEFLFPIANHSDDGYLIGGTARLGYIMSPIVVLGGSITYYTFNSESNELSQVLSMAVNLKYYISRGSSNFKPYLLLKTGFFFPLEGDAEYIIFPEITGGAGLEFLISSNTFIFVDTGVCFGIDLNEFPRLILGRIGVNLNI